MTGAALGIRSLSLLLLGYLCLAILINLPRPVIGHWRTGPVRTALGVVVSSGAGDRLSDHDCHMAMGCTVTAQSDPRPDIVR